MSTAFNNGIKNESSPSQFEPLVMPREDEIRKEFGYDGKPKQWQQGFDALLRHLKDYIHAA